MDTQELIKMIDNLQSNTSTGLIILFYYLVVYWSKIKDGLGLSFTHRKADLDKIEKNYQLLKLRIEIEKIKKDSGLEPRLLEKLEQEMQARIEIKQNKPFTGSQKFVAIPIMIVLLMVGFIELQALAEDSTSSGLDILLGEIFCLTMIVIGFWGIPALQRQKQHWLRKTGFIIFWTFSFYILSYILIYTLSNIVYNNSQFADSLINVIFISSLFASVLLGIINKLPFMHQQLKAEDTNN